MQRVLQLSVTILVSLAGIIFACAEGAPLAAMSVLVAILTLFFIDWDHTFSVSTLMANGLGLLAFIAAGFELVSGSIEARLLSGGHLIVYLTWVFLLQRKKNRHYWWLCALSVLQVAVASVLTNSVWYGVALIGYAFVACWTLTVFQLYRSINASEGAEDSRLQPRLIVGSTRKGIARDVDHNLIDFRFFRTTTLIFCLSLGMGILFFLFTPRVWIGQYSIYGDSPTIGRKLTGFSDNVRLGDMGEILESNAKVATAKLFDHTSGKQLSKSEAETYLGAEPLFRGNSQELYRDGEWRRETGLNREVLIDDPDAVIRQEIELEDIGVTTLFGFGNISGMSSESRRKPTFSFVPSVFSKPRERRDQTGVYRYSVLTRSGPPDSYLSQARNSPRFVYNYSRVFANYLKEAKAVPERLSSLMALSRQLVEKTYTDLEAAQQLQSHLRDSGEYSYSLKLDIQDSSIDPIEDFLLNRKQGHCEYFASTLTMMLRSVGIPARMVTGFKGGFFEDDAFVLQRLHAHSWVEAYIDGRWQTFDPTPGSRDESVADRQGAASMFQTFKNSVSGYWSAGVQMSPVQQREMIYKPFQAMAESTSSLAKEIYQGNFEGLLDRLRKFRSPREWISVQGGIAVFVLLSMLSGMIWSLRQVIKWMLRLMKRKTVHTRSQPQVEFYHRFQRALAGLGITQRSTQTAREFVNQSLNAVQPKLAAAGLEQWPAEIADKFYQVRFGDQPLSEIEASEVDQRLTQLEACLQETEVSETITP